MDTLIWLSIIWASSVFAAFSKSFAKMSVEEAKFWFVATIGIMGLAVSLAVVSSILSTAPDSLADVLLLRDIGIGDSTVPISYSLSAWGGTLFVRCKIRELQN